MLLDEIILEQKSIVLCLHQNRADIGHLSHHDGGTGDIMYFIEVTADTAFQAFRFADVEELLVGIVKLIHTRTIRQCI